MSKKWINYNKIGIFFSCPYRYKKLYLEPNKNKKKWEPNANIEQLRENILNIFYEETKLFKNNNINVPDNVNLELDNLNKNTILLFNENLKQYVKENKIAHFQRFKKPIFYDYNENFGFFTNIDCSIELNNIPTAIVIDFYGYQKTEETIEENREHFFRSFILREKYPEIKQILYFYPNFNNILLTSITDTDIEEGKKILIHFIKSLSESRFKPNASGFCDYCEFQLNCPVWTNYPFELNKDKRQKLFRLSYSKLELFKRCPFAYKKVYLEKIPQKSRDFFSIGTTIHSVMEELAKNETPLPIEEIYYLFQEKWESAGFISIDDEKKQKIETWEWFKKYLEEIILPHYKQAIYTELYFQFPIREKVMVNGYIDRIDKLEDGTYEIIDYKTEDSIRSQEEVDNDLQLSIYYWAAKKLGMNVSRLSLHFVRFQKIITTTRNEKDIENLEESISKWYDIIREEEQFLPKKNKYCDHCDFRNQCPLFK